MCTAQSEEGVTPDVDTDWYFAEEIDADWYFAELINRATESYLTIMPLGNPWYYYESDPKSSWTREDGEEYVAIEVCRLRDHCRPEGTLVPRDRDVIFDYRKEIQALSRFVNAAGVGRAVFRKVLSSEVWVVEEAAAALETLGSSRAVKNDRYNQSGILVTTLLSGFGLKHAIAEAALFLWYCGWKEMDTRETGGVEVIDPFKLGKAAGRRATERDARERWGYHDPKRDGGKKRAGKRKQFGLSLARMMSKQIRTRRRHT
jgi:hypothetical protein